MRRVLIKVSESHFDKLDSVVDALSIKGLVSIEVLRAIGVVIGECPDEAIEKLKRVAGVLAIVEDQKEFQLLVTDLQGAKPIVKGRPSTSASQFGRNDGNPTSMNMRELIDRCTRFDTSEVYAGGNIRADVHTPSNLACAYDGRYMSSRKRYRD